MIYLATIKMKTHSHAQSFRTKEEAEEWLDKENGNQESTTFIQVFDESWKLIDTIYYTYGKE